MVYAKEYYKTKDLNIKLNWFSIPNFNNKYLININGIVLDNDKNKVVNPSINSYGYHRIMLYKKGIRKEYLLHRLMALTFIGSSNLEVNHIDGNKLNNTLSNLEYVTARENCIHAYKNGLRKGLKGSSNPRAKVNENQVKEIREQQKIKGDTQLSKELNISRSILKDIRNKNTWGWLI